MSARPAPQYGEYASEEEQAAAMERFGAPPDRQPAAPIEEAKPSPSAPQHDEVRPTVAHDQVARAMDRILTVFLLSFGLVYVLGGASTYLNFADSLQSMMKQLGVGEYHPTSLTAGVGIAVLAGQAILWLVAAIWSYRRITRGRRAWWIPVLAGVASIIIASVLIGVLLAGDPALMASIQKT